MSGIYNDYFMMKNSGKTQFIKVATLEDIDSYDIGLISSDKLIYVTSYYFVYLNDSLY